MFIKFLWFFTQRQYHYCKAIAGVRPDEDSSKTQCLSACPDSGSERGWWILLNLCDHCSLAISNYTLSIAEFFFFSFFILNERTFDRQPRSLPIYDAFSTAGGQSMWVQPKPQQASCDYKKMIWALKMCHKETKQNKTLSLLLENIQIDLSK